MFTYRNHSGNVTNVEIFFPDFEIGDKVQMRFAPPNDWDGNTITLTSVSTSWYENPSGSFVINTTTTTSANQEYSRTLVVSSQMPEQKISDFIGSLVRLSTWLSYPQETANTTLNL